MVRLFQPDSCQTEEINQELSSIAIFGRIHLWMELSTIDRELLVFHYLDAAILSRSQELKIRMQILNLPVMAFEEDRLITKILE